MSDSKWPAISKELLTRFQSYLVRSEAGCLLWTGGKVRDGYGKFNVIDLPKSAHRFAFLAYNGYLDDSLQVCHTCDTPACCEPSHLFQGTAQQNASDMVAKGRSYHQLGSANGNAKLSDSQVLEIRRLKETGLRYIDIAPHFGVSPEMVSLICRRKYRTNV